MDRLTEKQKKEGKYRRIFSQLASLTGKINDPDARMATIVAVLHHKAAGFFWTGFYLLREGRLLVRCYQGPLACPELEKNKGVCWAAVNQGETIVVDDVHLFPGHIACDSRSQSEIVVPVRNRYGEIIGVLDVDSREKASFDETDKFWLEKIVGLTGCGDL